MKLTRNGAQRPALPIVLIQALFGRLLADDCPFQRRWFDAAPIYLDTFAEEASLRFLQVGANVLSPASQGVRASLLPRVSVADIAGARVVRHDGASANATAQPGAFSWTWTGVEEVLMKWMEPPVRHLVDLFAAEEKSTVKVPPAGVRPDELDEEQRNQLCRTLSKSFICIMLLSFLCLWQHISLAIARNIDELAGVSMPSRMTEMMTAASRGVVYPPMVCCCFVAMRMHVLASTGGLGEPPGWVKNCMVVATAGLFLQYFIVATLPLVVTGELSRPGGKSGYTSLRFAEITGGVHDVHPRVLRHVYPFTFLRYFFALMQALAFAGIYGGTLGVIHGLFAYESGPDQLPPSPAFKATAYLTGLYMSVRLLVWAQQVRSRQGLKSGSGGTWLQHAALATVQSVQKAPMASILFLTCRLRAMQLDPWNGLPQTWARHWFFKVCIAMTFEAAVAFTIGAIGEEELGYYGAHIYKTTWKTLHVLQHGLSAVTGLGLWIVWGAILMLHTPTGETVIFPPTMHCILVLTGIYFTIHGAFYVAFFLKHVLDVDWKLLQDTAIAANMSISYTPMLCVLFLACRLRAVQVTNFTGSPQTWAQNAMYVAVMASMLQVACCVVMPALSGNKSGFDEDGNANYDLGPMMGAYLVTGIKYFVLLSLMTSMVIICVSICTITPENANYAGADDFFHQVGNCGWVILFLILAMLLSSAKAVGMAVRLAVESQVVRDILGVQVKVDFAALSVFHGYVNVTGVTLHNPSRAKFRVEYASPYLLKIDTVVVKLDLWQAFKTMGKLIEIEYVACKGVHFVVEKSKWSAHSNLYTVKSHLAPPEKAPGKAAQCRQQVGACLPERPKCLPKRMPGPVRTPKCLRRSEKPKVKSAPGEEKAESKVEVILHELYVKDVGASLFRGNAETLAARLGDFKKADLAKEKVTPTQVIVLVFMTLLKTVASNGHILGTALFTVATAPCPAVREWGAKEADTPEGDAQQHQESVFTDRG